MKSLSGILVADGSIVVRALLGRRLWSHAEVICAAANVDEAEAAVMREPIDVIFADVTLPGGGTCELERRLDGRPERPGLIALSQRPSLEEETRASLAGFLGYLAKPIHGRELSRLLRSLGCDLTLAPSCLESERGVRAVALDEHGRDAMSWEARDLSRTGAFLCTDGPLPIGASLRLEVRSRALPRAIALLAEVVRVRQPAWGELGVDVAFVGTPPLDACRLDELRRCAGRLASRS